MRRTPKQFDLWTVRMEPAYGHETRKDRPCVVVSNDIINKAMATVTIIPLTRTIRGVPFRPESKIKGVKGEIMVDQIKTVDKRRLKKYIGELPEKNVNELEDIIIKMFTRR